MKVFILSTGRAGTVTFYNACKYIKNYTCAHESTSGMKKYSDLVFPDNHIEINPHLSWMLGPLKKNEPRGK